MERRNEWSPAPNALAVWVAPEKPSPQVANRERRAVYVNPVTPVFDRSPNWVHEEPVATA